MFTLITTCYNTPMSFIPYHKSDIAVGAIAVVVLIGGYFAFPHFAQTLVSQVQWKISPCSKTLTYRVGEVDSQFDISKDDVRFALNEAAAVWNTGGNKTLLAEDEKNGIVTVNLIYDYRQQTTQVLASTTDPQKYDAIVQATGKEFDEGEFVNNPGSEEINVYEYSSHAKLVRIFAHELGHSLGLGHVKDPESIMYALNDSANLHITRDDYDELNKACVGWFGGQVL